MAPLVSVVVPFFNRRETLGRALASVLTQQDVDLEIVAVDDGSTDQSSAVVSGLGDRRIRLVTLASSRGAAAARNVGVSEARGGVIAFLDSDDEWSPGKLRQQVVALEGSGDDVGGVICGYSMVRAGGEGRIVRRAKGIAARSHVLLDGCFIAPGATLMVRAEVMRHVGLFNEKLERFEDWDWLLRLSRRYHLVAVPEPLSVVHDSSWPSPQSVYRSADRLYDLQKAEIEDTLGKSGVRRFKASLELEKAVVCFRSRRVGSGLQHIAGAGLHSPGRVLRFLGRAVRKGIEGDFE